MGKPTHGHSAHRTKTPEYTAWCSMLTRCRNRKARAYPFYGGRGIKVCARWLAFENFLNDVGARPSVRHSVERNDSDGDYEPGNVRWATKEEQANNQRSNRLLTLNGETRSVAQWARHLGVPTHRLWNRVYRGWPVHRVLTP